jgi:RNA polymerase sigma factor (TIGR02999 family)
LDETRSTEITRLLRAAHAGEPEALERLLPAVYDELRGMANQRLRGERSEHTLQATALVHEVYLRLSQQESLGVADRAQFFAVAAQAMHRVLVDHARQRNRKKRGEGRAPSALDEAVVALEQRSGDLEQLDEALGQLAARDLQKARLVELRFFVGMTTEEAAEVLGLSLSSAERAWRMARAFLKARLD